MTPGVSLPNRIAAAAALAALSLGMFLAKAPGLATVAGTTGLLVLAAALRAAWARERDLETVVAYVEALAGPRPQPLPDTGPGVQRRLAVAVAALHRGLAESGAQAQVQRETSDSIIEAMHDPLMLVAGDRQVVSANRAARGLFGEKAAGRDLAASLRNPDVLAAVDAVLAGGASRSVDFTVPVPVERVFEVRVKPFQNSRSAPAAARMVILTLHEITALRRSEQMRADFVANASHELRTPLSTLLGFIETLRGPARDDADARDRFLSIMHEQASRMTRLVGDLLSLSRIELDEHMPPDGRVDAVDSLRGVIAAHELKAAARRIRLTLSAPPGVPPVVGDEDQLAQVFQNLVSNAIKYTREQTEVAVTVSVTDGTAVGAGRMVAVAVADQGEGIARTHLPRLTERFYRVDAARSRALGGTGLGLAIVKHILNRHRGRLTIESKVGEGSTFTVYLPVAVEAAGTDGQVRPQPGGAAA
ncbi:PAS domain-containing protein [Azospirillum sp. RWY-5-1]|uniref:histidine kinase n=1 Tax=Azospirillum oleiclasticum TaxID=2735135 RepID=A0ABX2TAS1_9PROT|nr:ATP-binding protein [Azospirillum oleiclasticum]NYZ12966.1 PAS domain-containing protein [Azospirillum oleiclasticum]NYZ20361.1 PAS domain-containing protein [Azospirillum oleiclasticum]